MLFICVIVVPGYAHSFDQFFFDKTLRIDYFHTGTKGMETISLDKVYEEGEWPGSLVNLLDTLNLRRVYCPHLRWANGGDDLFPRVFDHVQ